MAFLAQNDRRPADRGEQPHPIKMIGWIAVVLVYIVRAFWMEGPVKEKQMMG